VQVYWTDWDKQAVFRANKFNGGEVTPITATHMLTSPMVIHVYHPYRQPDGNNFCQTVNGHCSHLCLPAPQFPGRLDSPKISCACPNGLRLMQDRLMCAEDGNLFLFTIFVTGYVKHDISMLCSFHYFLRHGHKIR